MCVCVIRFVDNEYWIMFSLSVVYFIFSLLFSWDFVKWHKLPKHLMEFFSFFFFFMFLFSEIFHAKGDGLNVSISYMFFLLYLGICMEWICYPSSILLLNNKIISINWKFLKLPSFNRYINCVKIYEPKLR